MEFGAGILSAEAPIDGGFGGVTPGLVGVDGSDPRLPIAVASPEAGSGQYVVAYAAQSPLGVPPLDAKHRAG
jgi:hypothetical protein